MPVRPEFSLISIISTKKFKKIYLISKNTSKLLQNRDFYDIIILYSINYSEEGVM